MKILPETLPESPSDVTPSELASVSEEVKPTGLPKSVDVQYLANRNVFVTLASGKTLVGYLLSFKGGETFTVGQDSTRYNATDIAYIRET